MELALSMDFANETGGHEARIAVELSPESAEVLVQKIRAILGPVMDQWAARGGDISGVGSGSGQKNPSNSGGR